MPFRRVGRQTLFPEADHVLACQPSQSGMPDHCGKISAVEKFLTVWVEAGDKI